MAKKKSKRRRISKDILDLRKQFEMDNTDSVFVSPKALKEKVPNRKERKDYLRAIVNEFDRMLAV